MNPGDVVRMEHATIGTVNALVLNSRDDGAGGESLNLVFVSPSPGDVGGLGRTTSVARDVPAKRDGQPSGTTCWTLPEPPNAPTPRARARE